jgi:charged multivesicular body protein 3
MFGFNIFGKATIKSSSEPSNLGVGSSSTSLKQKAKEWKSILRKEINDVRRKEWQLQRHLEETRAIAKLHLKAGRRDNAFQLLSPIKNAQDQVLRLKLQIINLEATMTRIDEQVAFSIVKSSIQMSSDMSKELLKILNAKDMSSTVKELGFELQKAGILQEVLYETIDEEINNTNSSFNIDEQTLSNEIANELLDELEKESIGKKNGNRNGNGIGIDVISGEGIAVEGGGRGGGGAGSGITARVDSARLSNDSKKVVTTDDVRQSTTA